MPNARNAAPEVNSAVAVKYRACVQAASVVLAVAVAVVLSACGGTSVEAKQQAEAFMAAAARETGAIRTDSGLVVQELTAGTGESPTAAATVSVHYHGTLPDGTVFDSSVDRGEPASFALDQVIPCWTEGLQRMQVGGKARLVCPASLAYGDRGAGGVIPPGSPLVFVVELLGIDSR